VLKKNNLRKRELKKAPFFIDLPTTSSSLKNENEALRKLSALFPVVIFLQ
jgi:hypothetical protein